MSSSDSEGFEYFRWRFYNWDISRSSICVLSKLVYENSKVCVGRAEPSPLLSTQKTGGVLNDFSTYALCFIVPSYLVLACFHGRFLSCTARDSSA
jgi:hypothetical protein